MTCSYKKEGKCGTTNKLCDHYRRGKCVEPAAATVLRIQNVDLKLIDDNPNNPRQYYPPARIVELAISIDIHGQRQTPEAREVKGRYQLAYGHIRKRAFLRLQKEKPEKYTTMPLIISDLSDDEMFYFAMEENLKRTDIRPLEVASCIEAFFVKFPDQKETELAKKLNMSQGNVANMRRVLTLPKEILDFINEDRINFTMGRELLAFKGLRGFGYQEKWSAKKEGTIQIPKDELWLMKEAVHKIGGNYSNPCTVEGMKKSIHGVCSEQFHPLDKDGFTYKARPDFDTRAAGCLKCPKMVKAYETKSQAHHFCTDDKCWTKKQEQRRKKLAAQAAKRMEAEIAAMVDKEADVSQEIAVGRKAADQLANSGVDMNEPEFEGAVALVEKGQDAEGKQATAEQLKAAEDKAKGQIGTRAEILDLKDLMLYDYSSELKKGFVLLQDTRGGNLEAILDPEDCTKRCITGFHYAYNSKARRYSGDNDDNQVYFVCSNPKCLGQKKAAFTRDRNAKATANKRAESQAIKAAADNTTRIDKPRLKLIIFSTIEQRHYYSNTEHHKWWWKALGLSGQEIPQEHNKTNPILLKAIDGQSEAYLAQLLVRFCLEKIAADGQPGYQRDEGSEYDIVTAGPLKWLGVLIAGKEKAVEKEKAPAAN